MNIKNVLAVSGAPGLYKLISHRPNGVVVQNLGDGSKKFFSLRKHQFTPLESIAIFTTSDSEELRLVFEKIKSHPNPPVSPKAESNEVVDYFTEILPDYDPYRVKVSDMRKVIKWYLYMESNQEYLEEE